MVERWVVDASPLIILARIGRQDLFDLADEVLIPPAVVAEIVAGPPDDPARRLVEGGFGRRIGTPAVSERVLAWGLGRGETEVISAALEERRATVVLDDAAGRRCAKALRLPLIGTLGLVGRAAREGRIDAVSAIFDSLREAGFRADERLLADLLDRLRAK
ncbi:MAG TPA: DUF3368 domain-containing protein [Thermoanaerobaculia bacterium]|nr:DUF3368 domain-containing protein [Thermoanaerobaculia bacterium]